MAEPQTAPTRKKRRRRVRYAAPLGFLVLFFAIIGVIATVIFSVKTVQRWADDAPLRHELSLFLNPAMQQYLPSFDDAGTVEEQDMLMLAAIYDIAETERVRQLREKDDTCRYQLEEKQWRMIVPQADVDASFAALFGSKGIREHKTVGEAEYDAAGSCYYVPLTMTTSDFVPVMDTVKKRGDTYVVRVAYVADADIQVDEWGNAVTPLPSMGKYVQRFTVEKKDGSWVLLAVDTENVTQK